MSQNSYKSGLRSALPLAIARKPNISTAQGSALGIRCLWTNAPCKGIYMWHNRVALTGRVVRFVSVYPGRCPGLWRTLGFQPALYEF